MNAIFIFSLFSSENNQAIISVSDSKQIMNSIQFLYIESGLSLPSFTAPYSVSEFKLMLNQIDYDRLSDSSKKNFTELSKELNSYSKEVKNDVLVNFKPTINLETYTHLNTKDFIERDTWIRGWSEQKPLFDLDIDFKIENFAYSFVSFSIGTAKHFSGDLEFGGIKFSTNIPMLKPALKSDFNANTSDRAFVSFGGNNWSVQFGRDQLSWGAGTSGNLLLSDNLKYQNMARFTFFGNSIKYTYLASFFPHQINYSMIKNDNGVLEPQYPNLGQWTKLKGFSMFSAHRIEGRLFNRLGWALSEAIMFADENGNVDVSAFNPMLSYHSLFYKKNSNSIISLDLDVTLGRSFNLYTQIVIDDLVIPVVESKTSTWSPNSIGAIVGLKYFRSMKNYNNIINFEFAYTSPYLYLRNDGSSLDSKIALYEDGNGIQNGYGINFVVALREFDARGIFYDKQFLGYKYGGDALVFNMNNRMFSGNKWNFEINYFLMCHGTFDIDTLWRFVDANSDITSPISTQNPDKSEKTSISVTNVVGFNFSIRPIRNINMFAQLDFVGILNYKNKLRNNVGDIQLTTGITVSI